MANERIMVVEDESIVANDIRNTLRSFGYTVAAVTSSGEEAIKKASETHPDLVLMDIVLAGDMDGVETGEQIRERFSIPVVYLTAYSDNETLQRAKTTEPYGYILKPFHERELHTTIEMALYKHKMERKLKESQQWLATTLKSIGDAVIATDINRLVTFMNPVSETLTGWKQEEGVGRPLSEVFNIVNEKTGKHVEDPATRVLRQGVLVGLEEHTLLIAKDGTKRIIDDSGALIRDEKENITGVVLVFRDITQHKRSEEALRESEKKYSNLVENSQTGIYIDQDERMVFANNRLAEIYRYQREDLIGIETWRLVHPGDRALTRQMRSRRLMGEGAPSDYEARGLTKDGETIWIRRRNIRIEYEGRPAILGNVVDITEQKRVEEELRKINEELKNFVHIVSHDLKTPIISIQGFSSRLLKHYQEKLGEKGRRYLEQIKSSAYRMEVLVSDLLALSRIGWVVSNFKEVSSSKIVSDITSDLHDRLKKNQIKLVVAPSFPTIYCDGERIYQVFQNLLVNAIKFMGDTRNPKIEIGYQDKGECHLFYVADNGIGIDPKHHRKIFEMFQRLGEIRDEEGTGLGLGIVDKIVSSHGGKVWVESEKGKGATFHFTLPKCPKPDMHS
jgi:PAS domain S-box-containing protein